MTSFLIALQFLTRIPVNLKQASTEQEIAKSLYFYPLVGLIIGVVLYSFNFMLYETNDMLRAAIILIIWVIITGALHLDGLADSADALVGGFGDKEKTLRIMKDPYCGPVGVVTLVMVLLLKFSVIYSLTIETSSLLILATCLSRGSILLSFMTTPYARINGLGSAMAEHFSQKTSLYVLFFILSMSIIFFGWFGISVIFSIFVTLYLFNRILMKRIDGMTGDTLGAQIEILEPLIMLIGLLVFLI